MSKNRKNKDTSVEGGSDRRREVLGVVGLGAGLFLLIAMISLQLGAHVMGPFGRTSAGLFYGLAGVCGYLLIALGMIAAIRMLLVREPAMPLGVGLGTALGMVALAMLVHLIAPGYRVAGHGPGVRSASTSPRSRARSSARPAPRCSRWSAWWSRS
jgi:hypothetical protein